MTTQNNKMNISVTEFKRHCLEIIRRVERTGRPVAITRRGRVVAQLRRPGLPQAGAAARPWERLRSMGGRLLAEAADSVLLDTHAARARGVARAGR